MELLVAIGICKVISCRLIILYTQYCLMSVFICFQLITGSIPFLAIPPGNIWDAALCENNYCQSCILLDNGVGSAVSSYEFLVFCVSSLLSPSHYRMFQLVPGSSRPFQLVPDDSACCSSFLVLVCTVKKTHSSVFVIYCISKGLLLVFGVGSSRVFAPWYFWCYLFGNFLKVSMQNYAKLFMKLTYLSIFVSGNIIFYEIMFFGWKVKAEIWRIKFSLEKKIEKLELLTNMNILSPNDFVLHVIFSTSSQNMYFFKNLSIISFSSKLRVKYMICSRLFQYTCAIILPNFIGIWSDQTRYGTLQISCIYDNHWCLSYASLSFVASIF